MFMRGLYHRVFSVLCSYLVLEPEGVPCERETAICFKGNCIGKTYIFDFDASLKIYLT